MKKIPLILFIDDDPAINYLHEFILKKSNICEKYLFFNKAEEALTFLMAARLPSEAPNMIFLDINMPKMDGWEFLDRYPKLRADQSPQIIMLTTSLNPSDKLRAESNAYVSGFKTKPLHLEYLEELQMEYQVALKTHQKP